MMGKMVLVACEESQAVCTAFRLLGFDAFSADIQECSGGRPEWHILGDCIPLLNGHCKFTTMAGEDVDIPRKWDLIIAHPPCTDLAVSGARWFKEKREDGRQSKSIDFFMRFTVANCDRVAIENPVSIMSSIYRKPDQIIQPWQFGHGEVKKTCLWLRGLPPLIPTNVVEGREAVCWRMAPSPDRAKKRSKTYSGIARAMAEQWGCLL